MSENRLGTQRWRRWFSGLLAAAVLFSGASISLSLDPASSFALDTDDAADSIASTPSHDPDASNPDDANSDKPDAGSDPDDAENEPPSDDADGAPDAAGETSSGNTEDGDIADDVSDTQEHTPESADPSADEGGAAASFAQLLPTDATVLQTSPIRETRNTRISGDDRYATAAAVSQHTFPRTAATVFIASGEDYPDALSGAALAAHLDAPLLLTAKNRLPAATIAEIRRLSPSRIVIVGGAGVVGSAVGSALAALTDRVDRIGGADRYATSVAVAKQGWSSSSHVFIASGLGYADALSAGAAAAKLNAPVILVRGNVGIAQPIVRQEIARLQPTTLHVAGGTGAVHRSLPDAIKARSVSSVKRYAGTDRYETSALIARGVFSSGASDVYWANGLGFPDALAGASAAGVRGGALVLVRDTCVPSTSYFATKRLVPGATFLLGGTGALRNSVLHGNECMVRPSGMSNSDWNAAAKLYAQINAERYRQQLGALRIGTTGQWNSAQAHAKKYAQTNPKLDSALRSSQPAVRYQAVARTGASDRPGRLYQLVRGDTGARNWLNLPNGGASGAVSIGMATGSGKTTGVLYFSVRTA